MVDNVKKLYLHKDSKNTEEDLTQASSFLANKPNVAEDQYQEVSEVDFSRVLLDQNQPVELVKIDIEGYEIDLINHLLDTGAVNCVRSFYVETHERKFSDLAVPTAMLKDRIKREGYEDRFFFDWH